MNQPAAITEIRHEPPIEPILPRETGVSVRWGQLYGCADSLAIASAAAAHDGPMMVVVPDMRGAARLAAELDYFCAGQSLPVHCFPDWETLPYDVFSPLAEIVSQRLLALHQLPRMQKGVLIVPVTTLLGRLPPRSYIDGSALCVRKGDRLDLSDLRRRLEAAGYRCAPQVNEHGEFTVRGSLFDLFPMGSEHPFRFDLFDDEIDSIRIFDPETQRSGEPLDSIQMLPAREFPTDDDAITRFRQAFRRQFEDRAHDSVIYQEVSSGRMPGGIEYYLPLFFETTATLFDYLPEHTLVIAQDGIGPVTDEFLDQARERHEQRSVDHDRPPLPTDRLFLDRTELFTRLDPITGVRIQRFEILKSGQPDQAANFDTRAPAPLAIAHRAADPAGPLHSFLDGFEGRVLFAAESPGRREALLDMLRGFDIRPKLVESWAAFLASSEPLCLGIAPFAEGLVAPGAGIAIIAESQLFGERVAQRRRRAAARRDADSVVRDLTELHPGAPVVHEEHGVGRYIGLEKLAVGGLEAEFLSVEYAGGDKLYVPVSSLELISRYTGASPDSAPLHKLGGDQWKKIRRRANERVRDVAAELLDLYAKRQAREGYSYDTGLEEYAAFAASFPFEETPDQQTAIEQVLDDMARPQPMDRVVCGDVGFGKTEVAMRAAFVAAQNGQQVAILVPTTLLAQQHYQNFRDRFADWPMRIEVLSRFQKGKAQNATVEGLANGHVDIVIGTHKLIQDSIRFHNLGLVIIDEEHRFGVRHKEQLKKLRNEVDMLTLTATPIPRTLNMGMAGLRDLSIIATPPVHRHPIKTFVSEWNDPLIIEGCLRELKRGGQIYFLHNEVRTIEKTADTLRSLLPDTSVRVAHGQMRESELEQVMLDFYHQRFNILVCSTIIESGIDIPSANTIIINRADKLGLAQLHQLRGRVGRSHHRAYAYLLVPPRNLMTPDAIKRLEAIESMEDLGAGFVLATHDLEIRGAGELLGDEQSGQIHEIGFTLYMELLERTVSALKSGTQPELDAPVHQGPEITLQAPALLPDDYLPDIHNRLVQYKRIAAAADNEALRELQVEMIDRFGLLPQPAKNLYHVAELKLLANPLGIAKLDAGSEGIRVQFGPDPKVDVNRILALVRSDPAAYRLDGADRFRWVGELPDVASRIDALKNLLQTIASPNDKKDTH